MGYCSTVQSVKRADVGDLVCMERISSTEYSVLCKVDCKSQGLTRAKRSGYKFRDIYQADGILYSTPYGCKRDKRSQQGQARKDCDLH